MVLALAVFWFLVCFEFYLLCVCFLDWCVLGALLTCLAAICFAALDSVGWVSLACIGYNVWLFWINYFALFAFILCLF